MSIQTRRGNEADLDPTKLLPAEYATATDGKKVYIAFAPGDVKRLSTYEDMTADIEAANAGIIAEITVGGNAVANLVEGLLDGNNHMIDDTTGAYYKMDVNSGTLYLEEIAPDPTPPVAETILTDIADLQTGKLDKTGDSKDNVTTFTEAVADTDIASGESHATLFGKILKRFHTIATSLAAKFATANIVQTDAVNDATKVPSSAVTYALGAEIDTINTGLANSGWITATLINSWTGTLKYRKNGKTIELYLSSIANVSASAQAVFVLPAGYKPIDNAIFCIISDTTNSVAKRCAVTTDGSIYMQSLSGGVPTANALHQGSAIYTV